VKRAVSLTAAARRAQGPPSHPHHHLAELGAGIQPFEGRAPVIQ
jgi:hypothetical protein